MATTSLDEPVWLPDNAMLAALAGLSALEQQALDLVYSRRYTQRQGADMLRVSRQIFAGRVSRALQSVSMLMDTFDCATRGA